MCLNFFKKCDRIINIILFLIVRMKAMAKTTTRKRKSMFISWSNEKSKHIANNIKFVFENIIFQNTELHCFVSDMDIKSGSDWWSKISSELKACQIGIICVTKENLTEPWLYFEAGAMVAQDIPTTPLLINCNFKSLSDTPLASKQAVDFYEQQKFIKLILEINEKMKLLNISKKQLESIARDGYIELKELSAKSLSELKDYRKFNTKYVYPNHISAIQKNTVFISAPMSTISKNEYDCLRNFLIELEKELLAIGFKKVICPLLKKDNPSAFDGKTKAINENFAALKQVDSMLVIYPKQLPSSTLVEIGYGIALSKRMVIFYQEGLPYILEEAGETIHHVKSFRFTDYSEICFILKSNGMDIFEGINDD